MTCIYCGRIGTNMFVRASKPQSGTVDQWRCGNQNACKQRQIRQQKAKRPAGEPLRPSDRFSHVTGQLAGISYRRLDWWVRKGYLRLEDPTPGEGNWRSWPAGELEIAQRMRRLIAAGLPLEVASRFARDEWPRGEIAPGVVLEVCEEAS